MEKEWIAVMSQDAGGGMAGVAGHFHQHESAQFFCEVDGEFGVCTQCKKKEKLENFEKEYGKLENG